LRYLAEITKGIKGTFLHYSPTRALAANAIARMAMIPSPSHSIEHPPPTLPLDRLLPEMHRLLRSDSFSLVGTPNPRCTRPDHRRFFRLLYALQVCLIGGGSFTQPPSG
jgi:hypothetical protein